MKVIDEFTRECLAIEAARSFTARDVILTLQYLFAVRGAPQHIRSENGPEFVAHEVQRWLGQAMVRTLYINKASPWENGYVESFNGKLRERLLKAEEGWLDGLMSKARYREIQTELTADRYSLDEEIADLERHGDNRLEPMARFIKASKQAKKEALKGTDDEKLDFFKKSVRTQLVTRQLVCEPHGAW